MKVILTYIVCYKLIKKNNTYFIMQSHNSKQFYNIYTFIVVLYFLYFELNNFGFLNEIFLYVPM